MPKLRTLPNEEERAHFNQVMRTIREFYPRNHSALRESYLRRLENLAEKIERDSTPSPVNRPSVRKNLEFDHEEASRRVREAGFRITARLGEYLDLKRRSELVQLRYYLKGTLTPSNPPRGRVSRIFMRFLKDECDYNPYQLNDEE